MRNTITNGATFLGVTMTAAILALGFQTASAQQYGTTAQNGMTTQYGTTAAGNSMLIASADLSLGSSGQAVSELQGLLAELGYLQIPAGTPLGYYGTLTQGAVTRYQQAVGVPATGYFGPMTKAALINQLSSRGLMDNLTGTNTSSGTIGQTQTETTSSGTTTGYWYNGNWYNSSPDTIISTTTATNSTDSSI